MCSREIPPTHARTENKAHGVTIVLCNHNQSRINYYLAAATAVTSSAKFVNENLVKIKLLLYKVSHFGEQH